MAEPILVGLINNILGMVSAFAPASDPVTVLLTFFMVFAISFAALGLIPFLETNTSRKAIKTIVAVTIAYFSITTTLVTTSMQKVLPSIGLIIIGATAFMMTVYFIFPDKKNANKAIQFILVPLVVGTLVMVIWGAFVQWQTPLFQQAADGIVVAGMLITTYDIAVVVMVGGFIIAMIFLMNPKVTEKDNFNSMLLKKLFGGGSD